MPDLTPAQIAARVAAIIRTRPEHWNQGTWIAPDDPDADHWETSSLAATLEDDSCGTTCCIAGWAIAIGAPPGTTITRTPDDLYVTLPSATLKEAIPDVAARLLGITPQNGELWPYLFEPHLDASTVLAILDTIAAGTPVQDPATYACCGHCEHDPELAETMPPHRLPCNEDACPGGTRTPAS